MTITQVVDLSGCSEKAAIYRGMATAVVDEVAKQVCLSHCRFIRFYTSIKHTKVSAIFVFVSSKSREENLSFQQ